jgi:hypothetical protein
VALLVPACNKWGLEPEPIRRDIPLFPTTADLDYSPVPCMAHAAFPVFDEAAGVFRGSGRIWLKGSSSHRRARLAGEAEVALEPPYYTAVVDAPPGDAVVEFLSADGGSRSVPVKVPDAASLNVPGDFSALFFGDFQPFEIEKGKVYVNPGDGTGSPGRKPGKYPALQAIREVLRSVSEGRTGKFLAPTFICGHGDQVYVEGAYHSFDEYRHLHPMSAWTVETMPRPRVSPAALPGFLDACYRGHWSFDTVDHALRRCPSVMIWDDHDIRDGWGSQGDEHIYRESHFSRFRDAFIAHQFVRGPRAWKEDLAGLERPLWQAFTVKGLPFFVLDLRTNRDITVPRVIGEEQWAVLRSWFAALDPRKSKHYVLVSSVPIFYRVGERANLASAFTDEIRDDLLDTWTSGPNEAEWKKLVAEIVKAADRGLRGIVVSGDYHLSSLCRVTAGPPGAAPDRVVAYEMIASGFAAEEYGGWKQKMARKGWFIETPFEVAGQSLLCEFGLTESDPNFGGLEVLRGEVFASVFQATRDGCFQYRVPLEWEGEPRDLSALVEESRMPIEAGSLGE